jgi:hypothetical protein
MRANVRSHEFVLLWEAGLTSVQIGIEALSTSLLNRIGKGTTTIQNLHAMRLCASLAWPIYPISSLIFRVPRKPSSKRPCTSSRTTPFPTIPCGIGLRSVSALTVDVLRDEFGILRTRNPDIFKAGLREDVWERLLFPEMKVEMKEPVSIGHHS